MRRVLVEGVMELADDGETDLLIIFAHRDARHFAFETVSRCLHCAKLFVRDPSLRGWYNSGLPGVGSTIAEIVAFIRRHADLHRYKRIATLGSSMGGYASLLFGAMLGADRVLAFNPQTVLDRRFPLSPPSHMGLECADLAGVVQDAGSTRFDIVIGDDDAADLCHAAHLAEQPNVHVWTLLGSSHLLTEELNRRGELAVLLRQWFGSDPIDVVEPVPLLTTQGMAPHLERGVLAFLEGDYPSALPLLAACLPAQPSHPGLSLFLGISAMAVQEPRDAIAALRNTLRHRPQWTHAQHHLRLCLNAREPMEEIVQPAVEPTREFQGVGSSVDAAILDAVRALTGREGSEVSIEAEVVAWGVKVTGIGGARSFWARVRI